MKICNLLMGCAVGLLFVPFASGQDLSKYRNFALGDSLTALLAEVNEKTTDAALIHPAPALVQQVTWWPVKSNQTAAPTDAIEEVLFSFYNGGLYRMVVTYQNSATEGLSAEDMVRAISSKYGSSTVPVAEKTPAVSSSYSTSAKNLVLWEDSQYSVTLSQFPLSSMYQLILFSKQLNGSADAAIAQAAKQQIDDAPQREIARVKQAADDKEALRQANLKAFRP